MLSGGNQKINHLITYRNGVDGMKRKTKTLLYNHYDILIKQKADCMYAPLEPTDCDECKEDKEADG